MTKISLYARIGCGKIQSLMRALYQKLLAKGKPKKVALVAIMRQLLVMADGGLKSGKPFDVNYQVNGIQTCFLRLYLSITKIQKKRCLLATHQPRFALLVDQRKKRFNRLA